MAETDQDKMEEVGELSRDFGLDITVSDGGLVTSALNQRQYRAECGKLYQQFMLSMADYIFEETQLKKRLQGLLVQRKQQRKGSSDKEIEEDSTEQHQHKDEDAFTAAQIEEFRRLANSRASNRSVNRAAVVSQTEIPRPPTSASIGAPLRGIAGPSRAETPHIFPALRERPLTSTTRGDRVGSAATSINKQNVMTAGAMLYGGRDQEYDGVMDPTADFSAHRRMRMNPRAFSRLSSAGRIKVKVMDKKGDFVMKPVMGRPGVVTVNGSQDKDSDHHVMDSKDKMALVKTLTSFKTPTLASELKMNNLVAIQKSLLGKEAKRMTVGEVMAKSRDRRARLFRVQMSTGRMDDWDIPGEELGRPPTRATSAGGRSIERSGPSRLGMNTTSRGVVDISTHLRADSRSDTRREEEFPAARAKTAPPVRTKIRSSSNPTPRAAPESSLSVPPNRLSRSPSPNPRGRQGRSVASSKLSVVQLELEDSGTGQPQSRSSAPSPRPPSKPSHTTFRRQSSVSSKAVFPVSSKSLAAESKERSHSVRFRRDKQKSAVQNADEECSVHIKYIHTLRDSAAVVRRWKELDRDREDKLNKWRMRMSFAATRRGNLGKVLSKV